MAKKATIKGQKSTSGTIVPLIPFNCIFDTDFGLLSLISKEYCDPNIFNVDFFSKNIKIIDMVKVLYNRAVENPLSICINDGQDSEELYKSFFDSEYDDILKISMPTEIYNLIELMEKSGEIKPTIIYRDEKELNLLNSLKGTKNCSKIKIGELKSVNEFQQFYFKSINDYYLSMLYKYIKIKNIYIPNYKFNTIVSEDKVADSKYIAELTMNRNRFLIFEMYNKEKLYGEDKK